MSRILIVEDDRTQRAMFVAMLTHETGYSVVEAETGEAALEILQKDVSLKSIHLVLVDLQLPKIEGMTVIRKGRKMHPQLPFIVLTGSTRLEDAIEAMQLGAMDFINKSSDMERLVISVRNALALNSLQSEIKRLSTPDSQIPTFSMLSETTPSLRKQLGYGKKVASSTIPVLITGESGVGKDVFAHAIHREGNRSDKPFISVNCGVLPDNLVESTLFGHEKGSFTGATEKTLGKCREADGGVLFLDEVGELRPEAQVKLLRLLQQSEIEPVGSAKPVKVDVRVISATNRSLLEMVEEGTFRDDLYYRLNGFPLHIPSLRERQEDILPLALHLFARIIVREERPTMLLSPSAQEWLQDYSWPGNIREMEHILSRAVLLSETESIEVADLTRWAQTESVHTPSAAKKNTATPSAIANGRHSVAYENSGAVPIFTEDGGVRTLDHIQQEVMEMVLRHYDDHVGRAAAALGIGQSTLYKKMRKQA